MRKSLKTILLMTDNSKKEHALFTFIMRSMPQSENWKKAKKEWEILRGINIENI